MASRSYNDKLTGKVWDRPSKRADRIWQWPQESSFQLYVRRSRIYNMNLTMWTIKRTRKEDCDQ